MKINSKRGAWVVALFMAFGTGAATVRAVAAPFFQDHDQDYSKYKTYQQGLRDGKADHVANKDHSRKRNYKKDEDKKAYEAGYQKARGN
jgi:hypothetical protein